MFFSTEKRYYEASENCKPIFVITQIKKFLKPQYITTFLEFYLNVWVYDTKSDSRKT